MNRKNTLCLISLDLPLIVEIIIQTQEQQTWHYIFIILYLILMLFQICLINYSSHKVQLKILTVVCIMGKQIFLWVLLENQQYSTSLQMSLVFQFNIFYSNQTHLFQGCLTFFCFINIFQPSQQPIVSVSLYILLFIIVVQSFWIVFNHYNQNHSAQEAQLSQNTINIEFQTVRRSLYNQTAREEADEPWNKLKWLQDEKLMVLTFSMESKQINFSLNQYYKGSFLPEQQNNTILFDVFLNQQIKILSKLDQSVQSSMFNHNNLRLRQLLDHISKQQNAELMLTQIFIKGPDFEMPKYMLNIFIINEGQLYFILHFQQVPQVYSSHQTLKDICKSISHELGTNLNCMQTLSQEGSQNDQISTQIKNEYLNPISINASQLNLIISNIRDYGYMETEQFNLRLTQFDMLQVIEEVAQYFNESAQAKNIQIFIFAKETIITNDRERFKQVFYQIFSNSIRYTNHGRVLVRLRDTEQYVEVEIEDTGTGLNQEEAKNLYSLLNHNKLMRISKQSVGSGLGLFISNNIVKKMNNDDADIIQFESDPEQGTEFVFRIRNINISLEELSRGQSQNTIVRFRSNGSYYENTFAQRNVKKTRTNGTYLSNIRTPEQELLSFQSLGTEEVNQLISQLPNQIPKFQDQINGYTLKSDCCSRVLIVDDEFFNLIAIKQILRKWNTICDFAFNGKDALNQIYEKLNHPCPKCKNKCYKIFFLDINMPVMDGIEAVMKIKQMMEQLIIKRAYCIANTAFCDLETKENAYQAGMDHLLTKPINCNELNQLLERIFTNGCFITGKLYTPKLYPAQDIDVTLVLDKQKIHNKTDIRGEFYLNIEIPQTNVGLLIMNIANQYVQEKRVQCNTDIGDLMLDNNKRINTRIQGCVEQIDNNNATQANLEIKYIRPTLFDIQKVQTDVNGCFDIKDQLMDIMVYEVFIKITKTGYLDTYVCDNHVCYNNCTCDNGISLFDTYTYIFPSPIIITPDYIDVLFNITLTNQNINQFYVSLSCQTDNQIAYKIGNHYEDTVIIVENQTFMRNVEYICALLIQNKQYGVDSKVFKLNAQNMIQANLKQRFKQSIITSQVIFNNKGLSDVSIDYSFQNTTGSVLTDSNGNFSIYLQIEKSQKVIIIIKKFGFLEQKLTIQTQNPPFHMFLDPIQLIKTAIQVELDIKISGIVQTIFQDKILNSLIELDCSEQKFNTKSNIDGYYVIKTQFNINMTYCELSLQMNGFESQKRSLNIGSDIIEVNDRVYKIDQEINFKLQPNKQTINVTAQLIQASGFIYYWLQSAYLKYHPNRFANPLMNQSAHIGGSIQLKNQDQIQFQFIAYEPYIYQLQFQVLLGNQSISLTSNSSDGIISLGNISQSVIMSVDHTILLGRIIQMQETDCGIQQVNVSFYYQFMEKKYIGSVLTEQLGMFRNEISNPLVEGNYIIIMEFEKDGYLDNSVEMTLEFRRNKTINVGTFEMLALRHQDC